jgi:hypothetical protein
MEFNAVTTDVLRNFKAENYELLVEKCPMPSSSWDEKFH